MLLNFDDSIIEGNLKVSLVISWWTLEDVTASSTNPLTDTAKPTCDLYYACLKLIYNKMAVMDLHSHCG